MILGFVIAGVASLIAGYCYVAWTFYKEIRQEKKQHGVTYRWFSFSSFKKYKPFFQKLVSR